MNTIFLWMIEMHWNDDRFHMLSLSADRYGLPHVLHQIICEYVCVCVWIVLNMCNCTHERTHKISCLLYPDCEIKGTILIEYFFCIFYCWRYTITKTICICSNKYSEIQENIVYYDFIHDSLRHHMNTIFLWMIEMHWNDDRFHMLSLSADRYGLPHVLHESA